MQIGFALTQHCNLRCPHCIRDDITTVRSLSVDFITRVIDEASEIFDDFSVSLTGGEPLLHQDFDALIDAFKARGVAYRFVSNGWHMKRALPSLEKHPPQFVRLSLSGGDKIVHDEERGRGSFERVLLATALLTSRRIPVSWSFIVDKRTRHQITEVAELANALGVMDLHYILPQPTPGSAARDSDLAPAEWIPVRREIEKLASSKTAIAIDYGVPSDGEEISCATKQLQRITVDAHGRMVLCCQISDYGNNETEVVADLNRESFADAYRKHVARMNTFKQVTAASEHAGWELEKFPCMRCARASGKLTWLRAYPQSSWSFAAEPQLVQIA